MKVFGLVIQSVQRIYAFQRSVFIGLAERSELVARFLAHAFGDLRPERSKLVARVFAIYTNLRPERSERLDQFFAIFTKCRPQKDLNFWAFLRIRKQKGVNFLLFFFVYFDEVETRKE